MIVVNLFGGPGAGKSTTAALLFGRMKLLDMSVELVTEYAKDMVWEERGNVLTDQLYILAKQTRRLDRLRGKVDWVVTDAPLINGLVYAPSGYYGCFAPLVREIFATYDNVNFLIERRFAYRPEGRYQDEVGAVEIDRSVEEMLAREGVPHVAVGADEAVDRIVARLVEGA